jgi:hypothetical protein
MFMALEQEIITVGKAMMPTSFPPFWECCFKPIILAHPVVAVTVVSSSLFGAVSYYVFNKQKKPTQKIRANM